MIRKRKISGPESHPFNGQKWKSEKGNQRELKNNYAEAENRMRINMTKLRFKSITTRT